MMSELLTSEPHTKAPHRLAGRGLVGRGRGWAFLLALGMGLAILSGPASAQEDDDDDLTFEQNIIRSLLGGGGGAGIDYRERSPLVIPPSNELPPPAAEASASPGGAGWPRDPDKSKKTRKPTTIRGAVEEIDRQNRVLTPDELRRGAVAGSRAQAPARTQSDNEMGRPLRPSELGESKGLFGMFSRATGLEKPQPFDGEPARAKLTQPPSGYRTPDATQPYAPPGGKSIIPTIPSFTSRVEKPLTQ